MRRSGGQRENRRRLSGPLYSLVAASAALCSVLACGLVLSSAPALASSNSFGNKGSSQGQFEEPTGVAVNETSGYVYVVDKGNDRVQIFNSSGEYKGQFNGSEAPTGAFSLPEGIAVDNSCVGGALECADESVQDVYVVDTGHNVIDKFGPEGKYLNQLTGTVPGEPFSGKLGVTVDLRGNVWVSEEGGNVDEFNNSKSNVFLQRSVLPFKLLPQIAIGPTGRLYVINAEHNVYFQGEDSMVPLQATPCGCDTGIAVDTTGDLYVDEGTSASEYTSTGSPIGSRLGSGELAAATGITVNSGTGPVFEDTGAGNVYVADPGSDAVWIFTTKPSIEGLSASNITPDDATLEAQINPEGEETSYEFFLESPWCGTRGPGACEAGGGVLIAHGIIPAGLTAQTVSVDLAGAGQELSPGETYGYRVVATNKAGESLYHEKTFTTLAPPTIESESVANVTEHDATLQAMIDPNGRYTGYEFQIDTNSRYDLSGPVCPFELPGYAVCEAIRVGEPLPAGLVEPEPEYLPATSAAQSVSLDLASIGAVLAPGTTYHYRVIAANGGSPTIQGPDQTFTTMSSRARPLGGEPEPTGGGIQSGPSSATVQGGSSGTPGGKPSGSSGKTVSHKVLTRGQELAKALKQCKKEPKRKQAACEKQAHKKYAPVKKKSKKK